MNALAEPATSIARLLFQLKSPEEVEALIASVPNAVWQPVGGPDINNYAQINVGADATDALMEKVTNGMDAILEREVALTGRSDFPDPRAASDALLNVPQGHVVNLRDAAKRRSLAEQLTLTVRDSGSPTEPTVVVEDRGIGQHPKAFSSTLLSLNRKNKRNKLYLLGAYGWGGAASYAFSAYTVYVSRRHSETLSSGESDQVGWTVVRYNDLSSDRFSKTGEYEYLCVETDNGLEPPTLSVADLADDRQAWHGTSCTLVRYQLGRYAAEPTFRPSRSLWVLCNALLLDPIMPFLLRDERPRSISANRTSALDGVVINGSVARLTESAMRRGKQNGSGEVKEGEGRVSYSESFRGRLTSGGEVTVKYWVLGETGKSKRDWEPTRTYFPADQAVIVAHHGQRHQTYPRLLFEKLGLLALSKFLIAYVDCDRLTWQEKRQLFSTTRDRLKDTDVAREVREQVDHALRSDEALRSEERARKERSLARRSKEQAERIKKLLDKAVESMREAQEVRYRKVLSSNPELPLFEGQPLLDRTPPEETPQPPLPPPSEFGEDPTYFVVLNSPVQVPIGGRAVIRLKVDAEDDYLEREGVELGFLMSKGESVFRIDGSSSIRQGRLRFTVGAAHASSGERGRVLFSLLRPKGLPLVTEAELVTVEPPQRRVRVAGKAKGKEQGPKIEPVYQEDWELFGFDENTVAKLVPDVEDSTLVTIYINWNYPPLDAKLMQEHVKPEQIESYKERFAASMALLTWLQHQDGVDVQGTELKRAAQMYLFSTFIGGGGV